MTDSISRQAAIDALGEEPPVWYDGEDELAERYQWRRDIAAIKALPSAQPEIIRCKDCRYNNDCVIQYSAQSGDEFFCGCAERKDNG